MGVLWVHTCVSVGEDSSPRVCARPGPHPWDHLCCSEALAQGRQDVHSSSGHYPLAGSLPCRRPWVGSGVTSSHLAQALPAPLHPLWLSGTLPCSAPPVRVLLGRERVCVC